MLSRLKKPGTFQGARYELFATASMIRAGFEIEFEDERDGSSGHVELVAVHSGTGQRIAIEAKSRHLDGILGYSADQPWTVETLEFSRNHIKDGCRKPVSDPYILFIDLNLPPEYEQIRGNEWIKEAKRRLKGQMVKMREQFPLNYVIFTNFPHHYGRAGGSVPSKSIVTMPIDDPLRPIRYPESFNSVLISLDQYGRVPNHFPD